MTLKGKGVKRSREWQCSWLGYLAGFFKYSKSAGKVREKYGYGYVRKTGFWCGYGRSTGAFEKLGAESGTGTGYI